MPASTWVVDTHIHMWDLSRPELTYSWLDARNAHSVLTPDEIRRLAVPSMDGEMIAAACIDADVPAVVHVQAAVGTDDPVLETLWLEQQRHATGFPQAIVGSADLASPNLEHLLDRHQAASPVFVGIRDFGQGREYLDDPQWNRGIATLAERGLVACVDVGVARMKLLDALARRNPTALLVLDHMGMPTSRDEQGFQAWQEAIRPLGDRPNVFCKVSEQTMVLHGWNPDNAARWMRSCIDIFGGDRCFFGSNWPVDGLYVGYPELVDAYRKVARNFDIATSEALRWRTAGKIFGLDLPSTVT